MDKEFPMPDLAKREENFYNGKIPSADDPFINKKKTYYIDLQLLVERIEAVIKRVGTDSMEDTLRLIFSDVYDFVIEYNKKTQNDCYCIFGKNESIYNDTFEACFFISLCMFLHDSKRIAGMTQREFVYKHDPLKFNVKESPNYFDYNHKYRDNNNYELVRTTGNKLRTYRKRHFSFRPVHNSKEWSTIRMDSEHEWKLYFDLNQAEKKVQDTYKRIRNLYNEIYEVLNSSPESISMEELGNAYKMFKSRLKKIKYEDYLDIIDFCLKHINKDKAFYGINLYRLEKELQPFKITNEVNRLLACKDGHEEDVALKKFFLLQRIPFPKIYEYIYTQIDETRIVFVPSLFYSFMDQLVQSSRLVIDKFVENGLLGDDWINFLLRTVNDLASSVLYDPKIIDRTVTPESQDAFEKDLNCPIIIGMYNQIQSLKSLQKSEYESVSEGVQHMDVTHGTSDHSEAVEGTEDYLHKSAEGELN